MTKGITAHSRKYDEQGTIRLELDTTTDGMSAWTKDFQDVKEIERWMLALAPAETTQIRDFITRTVNFGEARVVIPCDDGDFSKYGFEKLPPA